MTARWVEAEDTAGLKAFANANQASLAADYDGSPVFLARNAWHLQDAQESWPEIRFLETKEQAT
jgi:peptide chain release factor 3